MTIPSENKRNDYTGNGAADTYDYTFKITSESDIKVSQRDTDDVEAPLTLNVDYTVSGVGALNGGSIVLTAGNLTTDYHLTIRRDSDLTQLTDVRNQGDFFPEVHEDTFDKLASVSLTQQSEIDRCVKLSETYDGVSVELPGPQAGRVLKWNDAGNALINVSTGDAVEQIPADDSVTPAKIQSGLPFVFPETLVLKRGSDVASAAALPVINDGNYVDITGSDDIDSIDSIGVGTWLLTQFDGALNLNHGANLFLCAGGANILTAAGDHALFVEHGIGVWRCAGYFKANGQPIVLTGITFTNPVLAAATLNTSVEGTAFQDDDSFVSASPSKFASSESIKALVDAGDAKSGYQIFTASGDFTVPPGVTKVLVSITGGGGGGGGGSTAGGGGGGSGSVSNDFPVTGLIPLDDISVTIGAGGSGGGDGVDGSDGGDSSFGAYVTGNGGGGGSAGFSTTGGAGGSGAGPGSSSGGGGGDGSIGIIGDVGSNALYTGAGGSGGAPNGSEGGGGGGGGGIYGDGGNGSEKFNTSDDAAANTGAGGGGGPGTGGGGTSAAGGSGMVVITW